MSGTGHLSIQRSATCTLMLYGCKVALADLKAIVRTAAAGGAANMELSVSATQGISKIDAANLDELLAALDPSRRLDRIDISATGNGLGKGLDNPESKSTYVSVSLSPSRAVISVSSPDETWVRGRVQELEILLHETQKRPNVEPENMPVMVALIFALTTALALVVATVVIGRVSMPAALAPVLGVPTCLGLLVWRWLRRRSVVEIILGEATRGSWSRGDLITLVGVAVAVVTLALIAIQTFG